MLRIRNCCMYCSKPAASPGAAKTWVDGGSELMLTSSVRSLARWSPALLEGRRCKTGSLLVLEASAFAERISEESGFRGVEPASAALVCSGRLPVAELRDR